MPIYDKQKLGLEAKELGFQRDTYEKVCRLTDILRYFSEIDMLNNHLALKGGTAINLTVFNFPRLSVDIDLDFTINYQREEMLEKREIINIVIEKYMNAEGYTKSVKSKVAFSLDSFVYTYVNAGGIRDNIKIETNYSLRTHICEPDEYYLDSMKYITPLSIRRLNPVEIFATKIVAFMNRAAARDLYDLSNMVKSDIFDSSALELLRKCVLFYTAIASTSPSIDLSFERASDISQHTIKTDLYPVISTADRFVLEEEKERVVSFLSKSISPTEEEKLFLKEFSEGSYKPELLFDDSEILARISNHPMAKWKIQNLKGENDFIRRNPLER